MTIDKRDTQQGLLSAVIIAWPPNFRVRKRTVIQGVTSVPFIRRAHCSRMELDTHFNASSESKMMVGTLDSAKAMMMRFMWIEHMTFRFEIPKFDFSLTLSQLS